MQPIKPGIRSLRFYLVLYLTAFAPTAFASAPPSETAVATILACRSIGAPDEQLTCFRKAADALAGATATPMAATPTAVNPTATIPTDAPPSSRSFGAPRPRPVKALAPPETRKAILTLASVSDPGDGRIRFSFTDGSTWETVEPASLGGALKTGQALTLEKGLLGATFIDIKGRASIRVNRLRDR